MEWDDVKHFLAVARHGTLTKAARALASTPATVGRRIAALETKLGARLFDRRHTGYLLTETGEAIRLKAEAAPAEAEQAQHALLAADIKRFLDRPADPLRPIPAPDAPPGAPIGGDPGMDWLAPAPLCTWSGAHPAWW